MIDWSLQSAADVPGLEAGYPPAGLLSEAETKAFSRLRIAKRRGDWLLGRWTAKSLVQAVLFQKTGSFHPLQAIVIGNEASGAPYVTINLPDDTRHPGLSLSISHSQRRSFCAVIEDRAGQIGVDIEEIVPRPAGFAEAYFSPEEIKQVRSVSASASSFIVNAIWSAKEAALKSCHLGLVVDTRAIACHLDLARTDKHTWMPFTIDLASPGFKQFTTVSRSANLFGWQRIFDSFVLSLVIDPFNQASFENREAWYVQRDGLLH